MYIYIYICTYIYIYRRRERECVGIRPMEGMVAEEKRKKTKRCFLSFWYPIQGLGRMAHSPQAGMGDSLS